MLRFFLCVCVCVRVSLCSRVQYQKKEKESDTQRAPVGVLTFHVIFQLCLFGLRVPVLPSFKDERLLTLKRHPISLCLHMPHVCHLTHHTACSPSFPKLQRGKRVDAVLPDCHLGPRKTTARSMKMECRMFDN